MRSLLRNLFCGAAASLLALSAQAQDQARGKAGVNASVEGGAGLGGTGLDGTMADPRRSAERERQKPGLRLPPNRRDAEERDSASTGASTRGDSDLEREADREDEEFRKKQRIRK